MRVKMLRMTASDWMTASVWMAALGWKERFWGMVGDVETALRTSEKRLSRLLRKLGPAGVEGVVLVLRGVEFFEGFLKSC